MELYVEDVGTVTVVSIVGEMDGSTAPEAQDKVLQILGPGVRILLDLTALEYMSSAGARTLLLIHRQITQNEGDLILAGLSIEIADMLAATGFLDYFDVANTVDDGLAMYGE